MIDDKVIVEKKKISLFKLVIITILLIVAAVAITIVVLREVGKKKLYKPIVKEENVNVGKAVASPKEDDTEKIEYNGQYYTFNEDIITILVMGIDKETVNEIGGQSWSVDEGSQYDGGQADSLFLFVINPHNKNMYAIAINRNAMADVDVFDENGNYLGIYKKQIALQHGYGDGEEESCERQVKAVSRLFRGIPINAYVAISMDAIPEMNDAVEGIDVVVLDDIIYPEFDMDLHQGDAVTLYGEKAYWYVRLRNENVFDSNTLRLKRQKQYLNAYVSKAKDLAIKDIRVASDIWSLTQKYMVTDIDFSMFTYMVTEYSGYTFKEENILTVEGESMQGNKFEEYYVDEDALEKLIIDIYYESVK